MAMKADPMQTHLTVNFEDETYVFRIPTQRDYMKLGSIARHYRRMDDPAKIGSPEGLDPITVFLYEATAAFVVLLEKGPSWCWSTNKETGKPEVNPENFPENAPLLDVWEEFSDELNRFRNGDTSAGEPEAGQTVDSGKDTQ